jgi:hypothetical protein
VTELQRKVLEAIEAQHLAPRPYYVFLARRSVFWLLTVLSIMLGALGVAVLLFAVSDYYASGWRTFDNLPLDDVIMSIPVLWLALMPFFIASAYFGLRNTRRGYRFRPAQIIGLCLAASIGLGVMFHVFEAGRVVNGFLASNFTYYREQTDVPFDQWSRPDEGFLGGTVKSVDGKTSLRLRDFHDNEWAVDISGAAVTLDNAIEDEGDIAIRGVRTGPASFRAETIEAFD